MPRTIAIGDIHGCSIALKSLLAAFAPAPDDTVVFLGDYVDRGPDSCDVIEQILKLQQECRVIPLLGNHEIMLLAALQAPDSREDDFWRCVGGLETVQSYGGSIDGIPETHQAFFESCRFSWKTKTHIFVHANYAPNAEVESWPKQLAFWQHLSPPYPAPHMSGKTVVVGHTPQDNGDILNLGHLICLDTYCFGGGYLTAMDLDSGDIWQASQDGNMRNKA